jgi:hypothetical protein
LSAPGASLQITPFMVDTTGHHMTHWTSFFFIFWVCHARESYLVLVFYGRTGTGYCLWILDISAAAFAISHEVIKVASNRLRDKEKLLKSPCCELLPEVEFLEPNPDIPHYNWHSIKSGTPLSLTTYATKTTISGKSLIANERYATKKDTGTNAVHR